MPRIALLFLSNIFMTFAWYGQLRFPKWTIATAILVWSSPLPSSQGLRPLEPLGWRCVGAFDCLSGAAAFMFVGRS